MPVSVLVGFLGFSSKNVILPAVVHRDGIVFLDLFQIADVVNRQHGRVLLAAEPAKIRQRLVEQIVTRHHDQIVVHVLGL